MELLDGYKYLLKLNGAWSLEDPQSLDFDQYLRVAGEFEFGNEVKDHKKETYTINIAPIRLMFESGDKKLVAKLKKRNSQRLRGALWHEYQKTLLPEEHFDDYYDEFTNKLIAHLPEVLSFLGK